MSLVSFIKVEKNRNGILDALNACMQVLSCETPVVATNVGGVSDVIRDYENGMIIRQNDALGLAEAI